MKKRHFARTGLDVSEVVLGGGIVGGILILPDEDVRQNRVVLDFLKRVVPGLADV